MTKRKIKSAYSRTRVKTKIECNKSKCVQSERVNADINNIVAKAYKTGQLPVLTNLTHSEDLPTSLSYQQALDKVVSAQQSFERLPSNIRDTFDNEPAKFLDAIKTAEKDSAVRANLEALGVMEASSATPAKQSVVDAPDSEAVAKQADVPIQPTSETSTTNA